MPAKTKTKKATKSPTVTITLSTFDSHRALPNGQPAPVYRAIREGIPLGDFTPLQFSDYRPHGGTPLRDATAAFISHLDGLRSKDTVTIGLLADESGSMHGNESGVIQGINEFVEGMRAVAKVDPKAAGTVMAVIVTDGLENASREITQEMLREMVAAREADGFTFIYLGANQDAWAAGQSYGFSGSASGQTVSMASSTPQAFNTALRTTGSKGTAYLADNDTYMAAASMDSMRSIAEDGSESLGNVATGLASLKTGGIVLPDPTPAPVDKKTKQAVDEALGTARGLLSES